MQCRIFLSMILGRCKVFPNFSVAPVLMSKLFQKINEMSLITAQWHKPLLAVYTVPREILEPFLPKYTELDLFNGNCLVYLAAFRYKRISLGEKKIPLFKQIQEVSLRFCVKHFNGAVWQKGDSVISRIIEHLPVPIPTGLFVEEDLKELPSRFESEEEEDRLRVKYSWLFREKWQFFAADADKGMSPVNEGSEQSFVLNRPFTFFRSSTGKTLVTQYSGASFQLYGVTEYELEVDFSFLIGSRFSILNQAVPRLVMFSEGAIRTFQKPVEVSS